LFLQGPNGRFFSLIAEHLERHGHQCHRINLNASDWYFWTRPNPTNYRGNLKNWPAFFTAFCREHHITDLVLNGEQRDYHRAAIEASKAFKISVTVTDFGYLRPDWIIIEREGMSGNSLFTRDPDEIRRLANLVPEYDLKKQFDNHFWDLAKAEIAAAVVNGFCWFLFPKHETHHMYGPIQCGYFTAKRKLKARYFRRKTKKLIDERIANADKTPFFLFPMQLESDAQLRRYSIYPDMTTALAEVIDSFAAHAPGEARLMIKVHPLDVGIVDWRRRVHELASKREIAHRVDFIDVGLLDDIINAAAGIVTINSTVGVIGLRFQKNVKTLGQAIYDMPGITYQGSLDSFWKARDFLDRELCAAYIRVLGGCLHVRGSYYTEPGVAAAAHAAAARLHLGLVNAPADPCNPLPLEAVPELVSAAALVAAEPELLP